MLLKTLSLLIAVAIHLGVAMLIPEKKAPDKVVKQKKLSLHISVEKPQQEQAETIANVNKATEQKPEIYYLLDDGKTTMSSSQATTNNLTLLINDRPASTVPASSTAAINPSSISITTNTANVAASPAVSKPSTAAQKVSIATKSDLLHIAQNTNIALIRNNMAPTKKRKAPDVVSPITSKAITEVGELMLLLPPKSPSKLGVISELSPDIVETIPAVPSSTMVSQIDNKPTAVTNDSGATSSATDLSPTDQPDSHAVAITSAVKDAITTTPNSTLPTDLQPNTTAQSAIISAVDQTRVRYFNREYSQKLRHQIISRVSYPVQAIKSQASGEVLVRFQIKNNGELVSHKIEKSSGNSTLDQAALNLIEQSTPFQPLPDIITQEEITFLIPINYRLQ